MKRGLTVQGAGAMMRASGIKEGHGSRLHGLWRSGVAGIPDDLGPAVSHLSSNSNRKVNHKQWVSQGP